MATSTWPPGSDLPGPLAALLAGDVDAVRPGVAAETTTVAMLQEIAAGGAVVEWFGVNERRVDAVVSTQAHVFRLVYFTAADGEGVDDVDVYRRPPRFHGVDGGRVVVVNGPSGAGKSSVLAAIAAGSDLPWVILDEPVIGAVCSPYLIWKEQAPDLHRGFLDALAALARRGNLVAFAAAGHTAAAVDEAFADLAVLRVGLDCDVDTLIERERGRAGRWGGLAAGSVAAHDGWRYDARFDTTATAASEIAREILRLLRLPVP